MKKNFPYIVLLAFMITFSTTFAFADHSEASISIPIGSSSPGCETTNECYIPHEVTIDVGGKITWSNDDTAAHTVTSGTPADGPDGNFDSSLFIPGSTFFVKFDNYEPGQYNYFCMVHPWMTGEITVQDVNNEEPISEKISEFGEESGEQIKEFGESTGEGIKQAGNKASETIEKTEEALGEVTEKSTKVTEEVKEGAQKIGNEVGEASKEISEEVYETGNKTSAAGGCLIATAAYGTELAPQVQFLREVRDNTVMSTTTGAAFMTGFNQFYYSFSPTIADWERQNSVFQESVRLFITPMISTLSLMTLADSGSEVEVLGAGISVIILNLGMYIAIPTLAGFKVYKYLKSRK